MSSVASRSPPTMVIVGTPPQASEHYPPPPPRVKGLYAIISSGIPWRPCRRWFSRQYRWRSGCNGGSLLGVRVDPRWASSAKVRHGPDRVVGNHEMPGIPPALVESGCDGGGFVELLAPGALAPLDAAILFDLPWLDDRHGHVALLEEFFETLRNPAPLSVWPPDDDREGLEDALEGRPHVARRRGGDELGGSRFRDRTQTVSR